MRVGSGVVAAEGVSQEESRPGSGRPTRQKGEFCVTGSVLTPPDRRPSTFLVELFPPFRWRPAAKKRIPDRASRQVIVMPAGAFHSAAPLVERPRREFWHAACRNSLGS